MNNNPNTISRSPEGLYDGDIRVQMRFDIQDTVIYVGRALPGVANSASSWTIKKVTLVSGNPTVTQWTGTTAIWDNRASETYS